MNLLVVFSALVFASAAVAQRSCGRAPYPPPLNTNMTSSRKLIYRSGDVITYECSPAYMRLIEGSLSVTCQPNGQWTKLPVCQTYTYSCRLSQKAHEYKGIVNRTRCGQPCQRWSSDYPHVPAPIVKEGFKRPELFPEYRNSLDAQNYCRNPEESETSGPWCYMNMPGVKTRWGYCEVNYCDNSDLFEDYERIPGACGCSGEWYNVFRGYRYGNIRTIERANLLSCKRECDEHNGCQGIVFDEQQQKCWLKLCSCSNSEVVCRPEKHETYYRKRNPPCPGIQYVDRYNRRYCFYTIYNFNISTNMIYDWETSRRLCKEIYPLVPSDMATFEAVGIWDYLSRHLSYLRVPEEYHRLWIGLSRPNRRTQNWSWTTQVQHFSGVNRPTLNYTRWAQHEPTNGYEEQCAQVILKPQEYESASSKGRWADEACLLKAPTICEAKMPNYRLN